MWEFAAPAFTIIGVIVAIYIRWKRWRESQLRINEVLAWTNEVIDELQTLVLLCQLPDLDPAWVKDKLTAVLFKTSVCIERGRLFFKNKGNSGSSKWAAYRGNRPKILDPVVVAHQIAFCLRQPVDADNRLRLWFLADDSRREFVTLAQKEVGRAMTVSVDTSKPGDSIDVRVLMKALMPNQLAELRPVVVQPWPE
jgi:hypothetical protein